MTTWAGQSEAAKNEIFNIINGDYFRCKYLWPRIAAKFDMPAADPIPTPLTIYMADRRRILEFPDTPDLEVCALVARRMRRLILWVLVAIFVKRLRRRISNSQGPCHLG